MADKKYKIAATVWHVMHYHDLFNALKDVADFDLILNTHRQWTDERFLSLRPIPSNARLVPYYEEGKYDFALLNVDQQVTNKDLGKSQLYLTLNERIKDIPKVVINHGSPVYPEYWRTNEMTEEDTRKLVVEMMKELIGDNKMVVNSYEAASDREWGFGYPIHHGMNPADWPYREAKEPRIFSALSPAGTDEYYNRRTLNEVMRILDDEYGYTLAFARVNVDTSKNIETYKYFLGSSLIYLDPSYRTPMNRARTEAMLTGACVVQVKGAHDLAMFAEDGGNMVFTENNPYKIAETCVDLIENRYEKAKRIGINARNNALKRFNYERYKNDWLDFIHNQLGL